LIPISQPGADSKLLFDGVKALKAIQSVKTFNNGGKNCPFCLKKLEWSDRDLVEVLFDKDIT
jgi:hypothetical protein